MVEGRGGVAHAQERRRALRARPRARSGSVSMRASDVGSPLQAGPSWQPRPWASKSTRPRVRVVASGEGAEAGGGSSAYRNATSARASTRGGRVPTWLACVPQRGPLGQPAQRPQTIQVGGSRSAPRTAPRERPRGVAPSPRSALRPRRSTGDRARQARGRSRAGRPQRHSLRRGARSGLRRAPRRTRGRLFDDGRRSLPLPDRQRVSHDVDHTSLGIAPSQRRRPAIA